MRPAIHHPWNLNEEEAVALQKELAEKVVREDRLNALRLVAGVDVAYGKKSDRLVAAVVVLDARTLNIVETSVVEDVAPFPYIPGLFSFRELPPLIQAFDGLNSAPDLVVCDGHGIAHPRRFGLASHLGVLFDIPTIGCGKTHFIGKCEEPAPSRGSRAPLKENGEIIGNSLRTQTGVRPVYVSVGHRISLPTACEIVLQLSPKYRLPETTRQADQAVRRFLKLKSHPYSCA